MTDDERNEINARLARAMGWKLEDDWGHWQHWRSPDEYKRSVRPSYGEYPAGDFTRDPAASRELVKWIAKQNTKIKRTFVDAVSPKLGDACCFTDAPLDENMILDAMTAPLESIALAADAAIGGEEKNENP